MKRILMSLVVILAAVSAVAGATKAVFSDEAVMGANTFSTGTLEVRINGQPAVEGFNFSPAAPGDCKSGQFTVSNYGAPFFSGPSTLTAKQLTISTPQVEGSDSDLYNALEISIDKCAGSCESVATNASLDSVDNSNLLMSWYSGGLIAGSSETIQYNVCLPDSEGDQNSLQGKTAMFNFVVNASNP